MLRVYLVRELTHLHSSQVFSSGGFGTGKVDLKFIS